MVSKPPPPKKLTPIPLEPGDTYFDSLGRMVFTEKYHLKRGFCCESGCRHCPYGGVKNGGVKKDAPLRVVSLISSSTEMVFALGAEKLLVGRSHECDFPEAVFSLPELTRPAIMIGDSSLEIDRQVKSKLRDALSIYEVDREPLKNLKPDIILTQTQCEVCAVSLKDVERALSGDLGFSPKIVSLNPNQLSDLWEDFARVGQALEVPYQEVISAHQKRMEKIAEKARSLGGSRRVAVIEWIEPLMSAGNWMPELVEMAGGLNLFGEKGKHSPWMSFESLLEKDPEVILISPCGFPLERTKKELHLILENPAVKQTAAYRSGDIYLGDGNQYFNRPGPRVVETLEILAEILHPAHFAFGHEGKGWEKVRYSRASASAT
jgi:iron complex transport system substrate-binding protein